MSKSKLIGIRVDEELREKIDVLANERGVNISELFRDLVISEMDNYKYTKLKLLNMNFESAILDIFNFLNYDYRLENISNDVLNGYVDAFLEHLTLKINEGDTDIFKLEIISRVVKEIYSNEIFTIDNKSLIKFIDTLLDISRVYDFECKNIEYIKNNVSNYLENKIKEMYINGSSAKDIIKMLESEYIENELNCISIENQFFTKELYNQSIDIEKYNDAMYQISITRDLILGHNGIMCKIAESENITYEDLSKVYNSNTYVLPNDDNVLKVLKRIFIRRLRSHFFINKCSA